MATEFENIVQRVAGECAQKFAKVGLSKTAWAFAARFIIKRYYDIAFDIHAPAQEADHEVV